MCELRISLRANSRALTNPNKKNSMKKCLLIMCCLLTTLCLHAQQRTVTGKVTDGSDGTALPGVSILVKGTSTGTASDAGGNYSINVSPEDILVFSFIGFGAQEVAVGDQTTVDVTMKASIEALQEVVVIGYGEKSRRLMTESIGTVDSKELTKLPVASPDAALQGKVSGVQITSVDGTPGAPVAVRIRGVGTVGNTQPLYVIDGVTVGNIEGYNTNPLASINPADIETVSVLKDASAAAVYGVRAANGVILITTKRGKTGKPRISLDSYYGVQNFPKKFDWNSTEQYINLTQQAYDNRNAQDGLNPGDPSYQTLHPDLQAGSSYRNINTDWQGAVIMKNAPITNTNLSVAGGNENSNYYMSAGMFKQEAMVPHWSLDRYSFRANSDHKIGTRFRIGETLSLSYQEVQRGMNAGGDGFLFAGTANMPPYFSIYDDPNNPIPGNRYGYDGNLNVGGLTIANQFGINNILDNRDKSIRLLGGLYAEIELFKGLRFRSAASIDFNYSKGTSWQPGYTGPEMGLARDINNYNDSRGEGSTQVFTNTLTYANNFGDHNINVLAGVEYQKLRGDGLSYSGTDYLSQEPAFYRSIKNGQGTEQTVNGGPFRVYGNAGSYINEDAFFGIIGRLSYDYKNKYLLTFSIRQDATAHFAEENRVGTFPAVSAAWRISEEPFFTSVTFISDLKLRGSWGQLGNANTVSYPHIFRVSFTPDYGLGNTSYQAPSQAAAVNKDIKWERVETTDFGFDVSFFNNKLNLLATYYNRTTKDFLFYLPMPSISGFEVIPVNAGNVSNKGVEIELGYNGTVGRGINFEVNGNITTVKNRLEALSPGIEEYSSGNYRTAVGYPIGYFYGFRTLGIYQNGTESGTALPDNFSGNAPRPGDIIFEDNNGPADANAPAGQQFSGVPDGTIDANDRTYLGKTIPDFYYGITLNANFKGVDVSLLFQGVSGVQVFNQYRANSESLQGGGRNQFTSTGDRWTGEGTSNDMPRAIAGDPYQNGRFSDRWVEDAGYFRLRNVQIGYTIPAALLTRTKVFASARIYVAGSNLFRITKYTGLDPEVMTYGSVGYQTNAGTDNANIPQPRVLQAGIQLQF